jgi:hypothetical protein
LTPELVNDETQTANVRHQAQGLATEAKAPSVKKISAESERAEGENESF